jgi:hypothetical protein
MKAPRFLICHHPFASEEEPAEFILHNAHPRFLAKAEILDYEELETRPEKPSGDVLYVNSEGDMEIYRLTVTEFYDRADDEDILEVLLQGGHDFYVRYLDQVAEDEGGKPGYPVKDFNRELPGLKILQTPASFTLVYNGLVAEFTSEEELDEFLEQDLGITQSILDQGIINKFE